MNCALQSCPSPVLFVVVGVPLQASNLKNTKKISFLTGFTFLKAKLRFLLGGIHREESGFSKFNIFCHSFHFSFQLLSSRNFSSLVAEQ